MTGDQPARRYPALAFPEIRGVRLAPLGATATLVNLSATGLLVECANRAAAGTPMNVQFEGRFRPASIESRVVRCEVRGIAADGSLRFHIGLAFNTRITLSIEAEAEDTASEAAPLLAPPPGAPTAAVRAAVEAAAQAASEVQAAPAPQPAPVPRNRW